MSKKTATFHLAIETRCLIELLFMLEQNLINIKHKKNLCLKKKCATFYLAIHKKTAICLIAVMVPVHDCDLNLGVLS